MTESVFARVQRVVSAGVESAVGEMERATGPALMRHAIREVDEAACRVRREIGAAKARRAHAASRLKAIRERLATLDEQARFAMRKDRADLAEAAIARQLDYEAEAKRLRAEQPEAAAEAARLEACLVELEARKVEMEKEFAIVRAARREACAAANPTPIDRTARKVARAEAAFERAMAAAGCLDTERAHPRDPGSLAEVDLMRKDAEIAERMAALRAGKPAARRTRGKQASRGAAKTR